MKLIPVVLLLFFLVACAEELPPNPPAPGEQQLAGKAIGGVPISSSSLPKWAAEIKYTDIDPTQVKSGDTVKVTVTKPASVKTKFYAYAVAYAYNKKFKFWEKVFADTSKSGNIVKAWAENTATFFIPISTDRFTPGPNYVVIYWCIDTEKRDDKGFKIWDCQGNKWQLGAFEMIMTQYPDILIERDIENNRYKSSLKVDLPAGTAYTANYESLTAVKTEVTVLQAKNVDNLKQELTKSIAELEPKWTKRGNVCGFLLSAAAGQVTFGWLSGTNWLTVKTFANTVDDAKVGVYGIKYPSDCDLLSKLKSIIPPSPCGNNKVDSLESCDGTDDSACPGACSPDCSCMATGDANFGFCGDNIIEKPNKDGVAENCEPPGARDPVTGQLISSACFLRNTLGQITGIGACDDKCKCIASQFTKSACGDGKADPGEQCGDPNTPGCAAGSMCVNCKCIPVPLTCGNGAKDAGEQCDPGKPGVACPAGQTCSGNCLCVKKSKCGNGKVEPGEQCEKASDCPNGLAGTFKACLACGCAYFGMPIGGCGDGNVDPAAGEECEADNDCANPPGGILSPACNKATCKCSRVCGDGKISAPNDEVPAKNEQCDPPGKPGICPPILMQDGGCAIPLCKDDCSCSPGQPCSVQKPASDIFVIEDLPSNPLHVNEVLGNVIETVTEDMWTFLKDGMIGSTQYHEYLRFNTQPNNVLMNADAHSGSVISAQNELNQQGNFLFFKDGDVMFELEITFEEGFSSNVVDSHLVDLEGKTIPLFSSTYNITAATISSPTNGIKLQLDGPQKIVLIDTNFSDGEFTHGNAQVDANQIEDADVRMRGAMLANGNFELSDIRYRLKADAKLGDVYIPVGGSLREQLDEPQGLLGPWDIFFDGAQDSIAKVYLGPQKTPPVFTQECSDTDGGWNLLARGIVTMTGAIRCTDRCATSQELQNSQGKDQLFECFCGNKVGSGGGQGSGWTSCPEGTSCSNGACIPLTMSSSINAIVVEGTSGCTTGTRAGCHLYSTGTTQSEACDGCLNACCITYSCAPSGGLIESHSPAGCTGSPTGGFATGQATFSDDVQDVASSKGIQIALFLVAAMGILVITLLNFVHRE